MSNSVTIDPHAQVAKSLNCPTITVDFDAHEKSFLASLMSGGGGQGFIVGTVHDSISMTLKKSSETEILPEDAFSEDELLMARSFLPYRLQDMTLAGHTLECILATYVRQRCEKFVDMRVAKIKEQYKAEHKLRCIPTYNRRIKW